MDPRRRFVIALLITAFAWGVVGTYTVMRMRHWDDFGIVGFSYIPHDKPDKDRPPRRSPAPMGMVPGRIMFVLPGSGAAKAGITASDHLAAIDGIPTYEFKKLEQLDSRLRTGDHVTYRLKRDNQERDVRAELLSPVRGPRATLSIAVALVLAFSFLFIGLLVLWRQPNDRRAFVFYAMSAVGGLSFLSSIATGLDASNFRGILARPGVTLIVIAAMAPFTLAFAALTLHLALVFPKERPILARRPYVFRWIYATPFYTVLILALWVTLAISVDTPAERVIESLLKGRFAWSAGVIALAGALVALRIARIARREGTIEAFLRRPFQTIFCAIAALATVSLALETVGFHAAARVLLIGGSFAPTLLLPAYPVLTFITLYRSYRDAGIEEKRQVKWPLWGTMIAIAAKIVLTFAGFAIGIAVPMLGTDATRWIDLVQMVEIIPRLLYLLIPISFAVAILKYRLMNIDVIIKKTVAYTILSGLIVVLYIVLVGGLGTVLITFAGLKNQTMVIMSTLVVAIVFVPLRNQLQRMVDKNLFRQKTDYPQALRSLATDTLAASDSFAFLFLASETIQQALQNRSVVIFTRRGDELVATAKIGVADSLLGSLRFPAEAGDAVERPLDPRRKAIPESSANAFKRVEAALVVPVRSKGVTHGVIALGSKLSDREFDLEDIEFLSSVADQIAIALDRIRLGREEVEFDQARVMQQGLLPASMPRIEGLDVSGMWEPARAVGGDYYDVLQLAPTQMGVCIGDVAGKGMPAALLMSGLQAAVRASATENISPRELCERVRRVVVPSLGGRFVSFFFCTIDTQQQRIRFCNAGHNPPILARADGSVVRLEKGGPVFSRLTSTTPYEEGEYELRPGDRVVLFTDGVSEARDTGENDFGEERLEQLAAAHRNLGARELLARIIEEVSSFTGGRTEDDLTLVAVAFTKPA